MRWEIETWRKLYTRVDARWLALDLSTRGLADELIKYSDDEGFIDLALDSDADGDVADAIARMLAAKPHERARLRKDVARLLEDRPNDPPYLVRERSGVRIRNFEPAQDRNGTQRSSSAKRMRDLRQRRRSVTPTVTKSVTSDASHVTSQVTDPVPVPEIEDPPNPPDDSGVHRAARLDPGFALPVYAEGVLLGVREATRNPGAKHPGFQWRDAEDVIRVVETFCPPDVGDEQARHDWLRETARSYVVATYPEAKFQSRFRPGKCLDWLTAGRPGAPAPPPAKWEPEEPDEPTMTPEEFLASGGELPAWVKEA